MTGLIEKVSALNDLILQGKTAEAFDEFYHDQVEIQDSQDYSCSKASLNKQHKQTFFIGN